MPFKSKSQAKYMFAKHPKMAKEFAKKTPSIKELPDKVKQLKALKNSQSSEKEEKEEMGEHKGLKVTIEY